MRLPHHTRFTGVFQSGLGDLYIAASASDRLNDFYRAHGFVSDAYLSAWLQAPKDMTAAQVAGVLEAGRTFFLASLGD